MVCEQLQASARHGRAFTGLVPRDFLKCFLVFLCTCYSVVVAELAHADGGALDGHRHRVVVSTDVGGTDPDDFQSLVHLLVYADCFDLEGLVSSPYGPGRKQDILDVIEYYEQDYENLRTYSEDYPSPQALRSITKQGAIEGSLKGVQRSTEGSEWIVHCAQRDDSRPLYVLVWGGIEDLAQALHDAPDILPKLRVVFIGGPNKMWSVNAYNYLHENHPELWIIESNATYRGWFVGGNQEGHWGNRKFVSKHIAGRGALGEFFETQLEGRIKMGDTPTVAYLLKGTPSDPTQPSWGGSYVRLWDGRKTIFDSLTTEADEAEVFGVVEFELPAPPRTTTDGETVMTLDGRIPAPASREGDILRFRFSPRDAKVWPYQLRSEFAELDGASGKFTAVPPPEERTQQPSKSHPNWWIDDPNPSVAEGIHPGAKSVNRWREEFLGDFAERMLRCESPATESHTSQ